MKLFIDTNIILHFTPLDQVDWTEVCGQRSVEILFAPIVIEELDKHKRNTNPRISKRAKAAIKKIGEIGITGIWSENVHITVVTKRPNNGIYADNSLDKEEQDDRLLATIIDHINTKGADIRLITNDLGPKLKCLSFGIETISLPDKYELKEEDDELTKENNKLKDQINKYRLGIPKLNLLFDNNKPFITIKIKEFDFSEFRKSEVAKIESEHPYMDIPKEDTLNWVFRHPFINKASVDKYNSELAKFFITYEGYLTGCETYYRNVFFTKAIKFKLLNEGSIPANDIDIKMHFPDGFTLKNRKPKNNSEKPRPPFKPGEELTLNPHIISSIARPDINPLPFSAKGFPSIKKTNSYDVTFDLKTLKHNQDYIFDDLFLTFDSFDSASGFTVDYKIYAANIPEVLTGQLNVIVERE